MAIYALSDLHLSKAIKNKSMELFGDKWIGYEEKIDKNWKETVTDDDTIIIPGDISWANTLEDAYEDFKYLNSLPGQKIILKGNHDFYFTTTKKMNEFLLKNNFNSIKILYNNSYIIDNTVICGTRGWGQTEDESIDNLKVFKRELIRAKLSLDSVKEKKSNIIFATHFPPFRHEILELLKSYNVKTCIYGHLHGEGHYMVKEGIINNINFVMVSGDYTDFKLVKLEN